jgi:hypothetical protein
LRAHSRVAFLLEYIVVGCVNYEAGLYCRVTYKKYFQFFHFIIYFWILAGDIFSKIFTLILNPILQKN